MKKFVCSVLFLLPGVMIIAQQFTLSGTVRVGDEPAVNATVRLEPAGLQKLTNENGFFRFSKLDSGSYHLVISFVGYETRREAFHLLNSNISADTVCRIFILPF